MSRRILLSPQNGKLCEPSTPAHCSRVYTKWGQHPPIPSLRSRSPSGPFEASSEGRASILREKPWSLPPAEQWRRAKVAAVRFYLVDANARCVCGAASADAPLIHSAPRLSCLARRSVLQMPARLGSRTRASSFLRRSSWSSSRCAGRSSRSSGRTSRLVRPLSLRGEGVTSTAARRCTQLTRSV
jgi:hypothetical protein